jgi:hypothetical protein
MKCRPDVWLPEPRIVIDVKTCQDARAETFRWQARRLGYWGQMAWYRAICQANECHLLAVEAEAPYGTVLHRLDGACLDLHWAQIERALEALDRCRSADEWPGYAGQNGTLADPPAEQIAGGEDDD